MTRRHDLVVLGAGSLVLAVSLDIRADTLLNRPYWIHPALTEVVQQALVDLS